MEGLVHAYLVFPALIWAALRFRVPGAAVANFIISGVAVWATVNGRGPFVGPTLDESLFLSQTFMAVVALTGLILGATAAERSRAIQLRDEFLSMASHELRTPLTPLKLQIHMLRRVIEPAVGEGALTDDFRRKFVMMDKQVDRIVRLVDELLDMSRVSAGRLILNLEEVDLGALVRETVEAFKEQLVRSRVDVLADGPVRGHWDRLRVQQVVINLLTNAAKYGAGEPITLAVSSSESAAILAVTDRGIGIAKENHGLIFEAFERGTVMPKVGGLGLGLYIVRKIVEAHHGSVRVSSQPGLGSTFTVELPMRPPTAALT
jgi:signal transduction histidine kinase